MKRPLVFKHEFVEFVPDKLEPRTLYVSIQYATVSHLCACGCGHEVVTPLSPTDWRLTFNGETVSLDPSIGNWSFPCGSHYFIRHNQVQWSYAMTGKEVAALRRTDAQAKKRHFDDEACRPTKAPARTERNAPANWWIHIKNCVLKRPVR